MFHEVARRIVKELSSRSATIQQIDVTGTSALVVAPHQDDETLGCGGTIALKRQAGQRVTILFLTDGGRSHGSLIDSGELATIRHQEAVNAAARLGVDPGEVRFLDFPEGGLHSQHREVADQIGAVLDEVRPAEVYVTATDEPHKDHAAAGAAVAHAVRHCGLDVKLYEFPVWCWYHWPAVPLPLTRRTIGPGSRLRYELPLVIRNTGHMRLGLRIHRNFPVRVAIGPVLAMKRSALEEHRSQVSRLRSTPKWAVLSDVAGGEFQELFFGREERFRLLPSGLAGHEGPAAS